MDQSTSEIQQKKTNLLPAIAVIAIIAIGFIAFALSNKKPQTAMIPKSTDQQTTVSPDSPTDVVNPTGNISPTDAATPSSQASMSSYKNGSYSVVGDYTSPGGAEHIDVIITLKDGIVV